MAGYVTAFQQGLDNFSEDEYSRLRLDTLDALDTSREIARDTKSPDAQQLVDKIATFEKSMSDSNWDVTVALASTPAIQAASALGTPETLAQANVVEAAVIDQCGLPSTVPLDSQPGETLPSPSVPSPNQTDPPTDTINQGSEDEAQGRLVATLFGLTLDRNQVLCLGKALQQITDVSAAGANLAQYQGQFQIAFDSCGIRFTVPRS